jgi:hypothetical protein
MDAQTPVLIEDVFTLTSDNIRLLAKVVRAMEAGLVTDEEMAAAQASGTAPAIMAAAREWAARIPVEQ